jgi:DNA-binding ferritin-like protein
VPKSPEVPPRSSQKSPEVPSHSSDIAERVRLISRKFYFINTRLREAVEVPQEADNDVTDVLLQEAYLTLQKYP